MFLIDAQKAKNFDISACLNLLLWDRIHNNYFLCNLQLCPMSQSVCSWQAFPAQSIICWEGQELGEQGICKLPNSARLWPHFQTLDLAGKACQEQMPWLIWPNFKLQKIKCCEYNHRTSNYFYILHNFMDSSGSVVNCALGYELKTELMYEKLTQV